MTAAPMAIINHIHWAINSPYAPNMIPGAAKVLALIFQTLEILIEELPQFSFPNPSSVVVFGILCVVCAHRQTTHASSN